MPVNDPQPGARPYRLIEHMQVDLPALEIQERALLELMGGPFPERQNDFQNLERVLDVACGVGSWAIEIAHAHPHLEIVGITFQHNLVNRATERATAASLKNVRFLLAEGSKPHLPFSDEEFDLVNSQYLYSWLRVDEWPDFLSECWRITRPGGYLRMTEPERGQSTSQAFARLEDLALQALNQSGQRLSPDDRHIGAAPQLLLRYQQAGWQEITRRAYLTNYGKTGDLPDNPQKRIYLFVQTIRPLVLQAHLTSDEELNTLLQEVNAEIERADFAAQRYLITVCGRKPPDSKQAETQSTNC